MKYKRQNTSNGSNSIKTNNADEKSSKGSSCNNVTDEDEDDEQESRSRSADNDDDNEYGNSLDMVFSKSRISSDGSNMFSNRKICSIDAAKVLELDKSNNNDSTSPIVNGGPISTTAINNQSNGTRKNQSTISTMTNSSPNKSMIKRNTSAVIKSRTAKRKDCSFGGKKHSNALSVETLVDETGLSLPSTGNKLSSNVENTINYSPVENNNSSIAANHLLQAALSSSVAKYPNKFNNPPEMSQTEVNMLANDSRASSMSENQTSKMLLFSQCQMTIRTLKTTATNISNPNSIVNPVQPNNQLQLAQSISVPSYGYNCLQANNIDNIENNQPVLLNKQLNAYQESTELMSASSALSYPLSATNTNTNNNPSMYNQHQSFKTNYIARGPVKTKPYSCSDIESDSKNIWNNNNYTTTGNLPNNSHLQSHLSYENDANTHYENYENTVSNNISSPNCDFVSKMLFSTTINTSPNNLNMTEVSVNNPFADYSSLSYNGGNYAPTNNSHNIPLHSSYENDTNVHYDHQCSSSSSVSPVNQYYSTDALRNHYQPHQTLSHGHCVSSEYSAITIKKEQQEESPIIPNTHYQQPHSNYSEYYPTNPLTNNHYHNHSQHQQPHSMYYNNNNEYCNEAGYL